ncbi:DGQHR domain-containing protein [Candidatus Uhrbacteria bacterium]|nr:DGQHR domain-containing protein [Candidatus Uhrbacteria bacterium]
MALTEVRIPGVQVMRQGKQEFLVFVLHARTLVKISTVLRFSDHPMGVNRDLTFNRVLSFATDIKRRDIKHLRFPIIGSFYGSEGVDWVFDRASGTLIGQVESNKDDILDGCFLAVDDGQHRLGALELLQGDDFPDWQFMVQATIGMSREDRIKLFVQDTLGKKVPPRLVLMMRDVTNSFEDKLTETAYRAARLLNEDPASPFRAKIYFDQNARVPQGMVSVTSLMRTLRYVLGPKSRLSPLTSEEQKRAILNMFIAASEQWSNHWGKPDKMLGRNIGYLTLLTLLAKSGNLHSLLSERYDVKAFREAFEMGSGFGWEKHALRVGRGEFNHNSLSAQLDQHIGQKIAASQVAERSAI